MCGIAGIVSDSPNEHHPAAAARMAESLAHRGPDSSGVKKLGSCILASTRLAILDTSPRGSQPMSNDDATLWIVYNGECYNAAELRAQLVSRGHVFRSSSDTEVVLRLFEDLGDACVEKLRGMFAFAVWDGRKRRLFLARDRMGIKPLYYSEICGGILFASECKALLASGLVASRLDPRGVRVFLELGHIPVPLTAIQGVKPLGPGHTAAWHDGKFSVQQYWRLQPCTNGHSAGKNGASAEELSEVLSRATRSQLRSDVPVSLFLSGGADSASIAAFLPRNESEKLTALTVAFDEREFDESEPSRRTANMLGIRHQILRLHSSQVAFSLDHTIWAMDQPTVDGLNSYWICRAASEAGFKVALSGQGGDELFGGYESIPWFERFTRIAVLLQKSPASIGPRLFDHPSFPFRWRKLSYLFGADDPLVAAQLAVKVLFPETSADRLLAIPNSQPSLGSEASSHLRAWAGQTRGRPLLDSLAFLDFHAHLQPRLLRDTDAMSMAHSLELRPVFLDHEIVEAVWRLPASSRLQRKRLLLAAARKHMPDALFDDLSERPKRTFTFPFSKWLSGEFRGPIDAAFEPSRLRSLGVLDAGEVNSLWRRYQRHPASIGWSRIWSLFVLQRWCEIMKLGF